MVEAMYERSQRVSSNSFRKTLNKYRKKNLIFLVSRILPFACILSVSTVTITLIIITMFTSTCRSSQLTFSNKQNRFQFRVFLQLSSICSNLRIHWRQREMFSKTLAGTGAQQKQFQRILQKQTLLLPYKSVCQCLQKLSQTTFNNQNAYNETLEDTKVWK